MSPSSDSLSGAVFPLRSGPASPETAGVVDSTRQRHRACARTRRSDLRRGLPISMPCERVGAYDTDRAYEYAFVFFGTCSLTSNP